VATPQVPMRDEARACGVDPYNADCRAAVEAHGALDIMRAAVSGSVVYWLSSAMLIHEALEHSERTVCSRAIGASTPVASVSSRASQQLHRKWQGRPTEQPRAPQSRWGMCNIGKGDGHSRPLPRSL
jgi:hypothetical protein